MRQEKLEPVIFWLMSAQLDHIGREDRRLLVFVNLLENEVFKFIDRGRGHRAYVSNLVHYRNSQATRPEECCFGLM